MTTRKKFSKEFKLDAVSLVTDEGYSRVEAVRSLGLNANMLCRWVQEEQAKDGQAFRGNGKLTTDQEEIRRLKSENKRLQLAWKRLILCRRVSSDLMINCLGTL
jgi:transposase